MEQYLIKTIGLKKDYIKGKEKIEALRGIDIEIQPREMVAIIGKSGSGKSTLLHILGGMDCPTEGKVLWRDRDIFSLKEHELAAHRRQNIGFVFQQFHLLPEMTVLENIVMPVLLNGKKPDKEKIDNICDVLGISDRLKHVPSELSGGQQQRVAIARALSNDPELLLCDEPTGNLDSKTGEEVIGLIREISRKLGKTVLIVTHDLQLANNCERVIELSDGKCLI